MWVTFLDAETRTHKPYEWRNQVHSHWSRLMSNLLLQNLLSWKVDRTKEQVLDYFGRKAEAFMKEYKPNNNGIWTISIDNLPKIAMLFGNTPFVILRQKFV